MSKPMPRAGGPMLRDGFIYILAKVLASALGFATTIGLTWILSPESYGFYGFGLAAAGLGSNALFDWHALGFMRWYQSRGQEPGFMATALAMFAAVCATSAAALGLAMGAGLLKGHEIEALVLLPGTWAYAWFEFAARVQVANFRPLRYLGMNLARNGMILGFGLLVAYVSGSAIAVLAAAFLAMAIAGCLWLPGGAIRARGNFDPALARVMLIYGAPICATMICSGLMLSVNRLMLAAMADMRAVAWLTASSTLVQASIGVVGAGIGSATYSLAVRAVESGDPVAADRQLRQNIVCLTAILLPAAVGLSLIAPRLATVLLKPEYREAVTLTTPWLAAGAAILGLRAHYVDHAFHLGNRTWLLSRVMIASALLNVLLNALLIPSHGYAGAAMAMTAAAATSLVYAIHLSGRAWLLPVPTRDLSRIGGATMAMAAVLWRLPAWPGAAGLAGAAAMGLLVYLAALGAFWPALARVAIRRAIGRGLPFAGHATLRLAP